jgi:hypothetical protein
MNIDDRIRQEGRAALNTFNPSPDIRERIARRTTERARQRRQLAAGGLVATIAVLGIGGFVALNRDRAQRITSAVDTRVIEPSLSVPPSAEASTTITDATEPPPESSTTSPVTAAPSETTVPTVSTVPTSVAPSQTSSVVVSYGDDLPLAEPTVYASLGGPYGDSPAGVPLHGFSPTGSGTLFVLDRSTGALRLVSPDGVVQNETTIGVADEAGEIWAAELGPDDRLYVSRMREDENLYQLFTLVVYDTANGAELSRHSTDWECVESSCGEINFDPEGVIVRYEAPTERVSYGPFTGGGLLPIPPPTGAREVTDGTSVECIEDPTVGGAFGTFAQEVTSGEHTWTLQAGCSFVVEGTFAGFSPQADGSLLTSLTVFDQTGTNSTPVLVLLRTDEAGGSVVWQLPSDVVTATAWVDDRLLAVQLVGGEMRLVELT